MTLINFIVSFNHIEEVGPSICQILKLMSFHMWVEGILEEQPMIKLNIKVDGTITHVANTEGDYWIISCKGRVVFILSVSRFDILVNNFIFDNMKVKLWCLSFDWYLVSCVFFYAFVEALDLISGKVVVESDLLTYLKEKNQERWKEHHL